MKALLTLIPLSLTLAPAATIQWGSEVWGDDYQSDGVTRLDSSFTFELGTFTSGFTPTFANYDDWSTNWKRLDSVQYSGQNMYFTGEVEFIDTDPMAADVQFNGQTFAPGDRAYIWGYNSQSSGANTEATLISDASTWTLPAGSASQGALPVSLRVSNATTPEVGDLPTGSDGEGGYTNPAGEFDLQTAAVPEPSSMLFVFIGACGLFRRRR